MTVEKFTGSFEKEDLGCTIMVNETIQSITDPDVLGLYCYLLTKPNTWTIKAQEIMNHFKMGNKRTYSLLRKLMELGLLTRTQYRDQGKYAKFSYKLHLKMYDKNPVNNESGTESEPLCQKGHAVFDTAYKTKRDLQNKDIKENNKKKKKQEVIPPQEIVDAYHETLPDSPKINYIDEPLQRQLRKMMANWPKYSASGSSFTIQRFIDFLKMVEINFSWFLSPYFNQSGRKRQNNLRHITREINISKIINGEFTQNA